MAESQKVNGRCPRLRRERTNPRQGRLRHLLDLRLPRSFGGRPPALARAADVYAQGARFTRAYLDACTAHGLYNQVTEVQRAITDFIVWREENRDKVKLPDHEHVPFGHD